MPQDSVQKSVFRTKQTPMRTEDQARSPPGPKYHIGTAEHPALWKEQLQGSQPLLCAHCHYWTTQSYHGVIQSNKPIYNAYILTL